MMQKGAGGDGQSDRIEMIQLTGGGQEMIK